MTNLKITEKHYNVLCYTNISNIEYITEEIITCRAQSVQGLIYQLECQPIRIQPHEFTDTNNGIKPMITAQPVISNRPVVCYRVPNYRCWLLSHITKVWQNWKVNSECKMAPPWWLFAHTTIHCWRAKPERKPALVQHLPVTGTGLEEPPWTQQRPSVRSLESRRPVRPG